MIRFKTYMRAIKITLLALAGLLVAAFVVLVAVDWLNQPAPPNWARLIARAGHYDVRIKRDTFGVPHVIGPRDADLAFGLGFARSEDDFHTIQEVALATRGQLAAVEGRKAADVREVLEAYADGVNYYAALHQDQVIRGSVPFTGKDLAAGFVFIG